MTRIRVFDDDNDLVDRTQDVLEKFGVKFCNTSDQKWAQRGFREAGEHQLVLSTRETETTRWQEAVDNIYTMANDAAAQLGNTMGVELVNPHRGYFDVSSAIEPGTPIHRSFLLIEQVVEAEVRKSCSNLWTSIAYHNRKNKFSDLDGIYVIEQLTVIVFIAPGSVACWGDIQAQICHAIEALPFDEDVEIALEILPGFNVPSRTISDPTTSCHPRYQGDIPPIPTLGASIGPQLSDTESGSLGSVVNFQPRDGGKPQKCFLTAYHVVASGDPIGRAANDELGIGLDGRAVSRRIEISYPACCDGEYTKERLAGFVAGDESPERGYAALTALIEREGVIGEVIHASGLRHSSTGDRRRRVDWALVALHPSKDAVLNSPVDDSKFSHKDRQAFTFLYRTEPGDVISRTAEPVAFSWAAKFHIGRWGTAGRVNSMERTVHWGDGVVSKEVEVIPFEMAFAEGGDDGSMVFNLEKEWVGMVVGGDSEWAGYVTPAADIITDIEARTGGIITLI